MEATTPDDFLVREEPVRRLEKIVFALRQATGQCGLPPDKAREALRLTLTAECVDCGMRVTGDELLALSQWPTGRESIRIERLRAGYCARETCEFDRYRLRLRKHPELSWTKLLATSQTEEPRAAVEVEPAARSEKSKPPFLQRAAVRVGIVIAIMLLLFALRQLYFGGRIPLIREPEKFKVAPAPTGDRAHR
jgi:hypothetical protein